MERKRVSDTWERGSPYEQYVGRWSRQVAPAFLAWLDLPAGLRWVDVGCGTGALAEAIASGSAPRSVTGFEPSEGFLEQARERLVKLAAEHRCDRGDVERAGRGDNQEHREHMRRSPDHLVAHARDPVAVVLHVQGGAEAGGNQCTERGEQGKEPDAATFYFLVVNVCHSGSVVLRCPDNGRRC